MAHTLENKARYAALVLLALSALASGCGDSLGGRSGGALGSALSNRIEDRMGGPQIELMVYTSCESRDSENPETRCEGVRSAEIEVFFDQQSLVFDFSNAPRPGTISENGFEGYVLSIPTTSKLSALVDAWVDEAESNVNLEAVELELDGNSIAVDLRGLDYHDATFLKVDLFFE
jgi:hypothetical protein